MKTVKNFCFQGDVMFTRVDTLPADARPAKNNIVALSETHHHHVAERAEVFTCDDGMTLYMRALGKNLDIVHKRDYDTHETLRFDTEPGDIFKIRRQREYVPEGWRIVCD